MNHSQFSKVFIEKDVVKADYVQSILKNIPETPQYIIDDVSHYFSRFKKPYLEKRTNLNLFLGKNRSSLIKEAPPAYGESNEKHYYFVHAYNCVYECQYCYLQGYFNNPDIVLFTNHHDICQEITALCLNSKQRLVFHAGEFSDSLALNHLTNEWEEYFECFSKLKNAKLELRTKSTQIQNLLQLKAPENVIVSYSLSPQQDSLDYDTRTPSFKARLRSMKKLKEKGYKLAIHFDPIIFDTHHPIRFQKALEDILNIFSPNDFEYISLGVIRFSKTVYKEVSKNYPHSKMLHLGEFIKANDGKIKYPASFRKKILKDSKKALVKNGFSEKTIYFCMENDDF